PRIAREQRAVEVRPDRPTDPASLEPRRAVIAVAGHAAPERLGAVVEDRPAGMVLEAGDRASATLRQRALQEDVADHPRVARYRLVGEEPDALQPRSVAAPDTAPKQLIAAADRQERGAALHGLSDRTGAFGEIRRDHRLLSIL